MVVISFSVEIPSLGHYQLNPQTLQRKALARVLQRNAYSARCQNPAEFATYLEKLKSQLFRNDAAVEVLYPLGGS